MGAFLGSLNVNTIYSGIYNMIISQQVFDRIGDSSELVDKAKVDGTLYGDTKLFYAADVLKTHAWGNDSEAANLLNLARPASPECQKITINQFRQIDLTLDDILSKQAWGDEGAFSQFNALMEGMLSKTKRIYDVTTYNAYIGTLEIAAQNKTVSLLTTDTPETEAKAIAKAIADLEVEMTSVSRKFNEYGHMTKFDKAELIVVWNAAFVNKIKKVDLPAIFHKDGMFASFDNVLPDWYFGDINSSAKVADASTYAKVEQEITSGGTTYHFFPGELITAGLTSLAGESYQKTSDVICKVFVKLPPYMSGFSVGTSFFNPKSHTTNRYLTFGHNTIENLKAYPCVSVIESVTAPAE